MTTEPGTEPTTDTTTRPVGTVLNPQAGTASVEPLHLAWAAISDVGRVRKDNQDSGYAGPHLLAVADGVGGAARGDIASATAISVLRRLDAPPSDDMLGQLAGALNRAHVRIGELVEEDPDLHGTSTTASLVLFDGRRIGVAHIGDSRAYLLRHGQLAQLTHDHTFVQSLIDEGRITEDEARTHPHRNLILKALDANQDPDPDLSFVDLRAGDRLLLCSDGACGVLDDPTLAAILAEGTPEYAAVELVRASLEAGSSDNVTCVVADVVTDPPAAPEPLLVGAAAELPRRGSTGGLSGRSARFRARGRDTGELEAIPDLPEGSHPIANDPIDPEAYRYAPRAPETYVWMRRLMVTAIILGIGWLALAGAWSWSQQQFYVGVHDGNVAIFRGLNAEIPGLTLSHAYEVSDVAVENLSTYDAEQVTDGIESADLDDARGTVDSLAAMQDIG